MDPIGFEMICSSVMVVVMMLVILSVPSILLTVRNSAKLLKKYKMLRSVDMSGKKDVPEKVLNEWNAANSQMAYTTLVTEEIEKLNGLRPAIFQCELAIVLMIVLIIVPGFAQPVLWLIIAMIAVSVIAVLYGALNIIRYKQEYLTVLKELSENGKAVDNGTADGMYG